MQWLAKDSSKLWRPRMLQPRLTPTSALDAIFSQPSKANNWQLASPANTTNLGAFPWKLTTAFVKLKKRTYILKSRKSALFGEERKKKTVEKHPLLFDEPRAPRG